MPGRRSSRAGLKGDAPFPPLCRLHLFHADNLLTRGHDAGALIDQRRRLAPLRRCLRSSTLVMLKYERNFHRSFGSAKNSIDSIGTAREGLVTSYAFPSDIR